MKIPKIDTEFFGVSENKNYFIELHTRDVIFAQKGENWLLLRQRFVLEEKVQTK